MGVGLQLTRLATSDDRFDWYICHISSPSTGNMEGTIVMKSTKFEQFTNLVQSRITYVVYDWAFMGQEENNEDRVHPPDGTCGSVIWNDERVIQGFYQFYVEHGSWSGFSASVRAK
jgi:hypothetical protein